MGMQVTVGSFEDIITVSFNFDEDAVVDDVTAYLDFIKDNSCVALGKPSEDPVYFVSKEKEDAPPTPSDAATDVEEVSSSNTVVAFSTATATAAVLVMAVATSMVL